MKNVSSALLVVLAILVFGGPATGSNDNVALPLRSWVAIGPFGSPQLKSRPVTPHPQWPGHNFVSTVFHFTKYPVDEMIDLDATHEGELTRDVTGKEHSLRWQTITGSESVVEHPRAADAPQGVGENVPGVPVGLTYFSTWVYSPAVTTISARFPAYGEEPQALGKLGACARVWINGESVELMQAHPENQWLFHPKFEQPLKLRAGWNHIFARVWSSWSGIKLAVELLVPRDRAFDFKVSALPPAELGRRFTPAGARAQP